MVHQNSSSEHDTFCFGKFFDGRFGNFPHKKCLHYRPEDFCCSGRRRQKWSSRVCFCSNPAGLLGEGSVFQRILVIDIQKLFELFLIIFTASCFDRDFHIELIENFGKEMIQFIGINKKPDPLFRLTTVLDGQRDSD